MIYNDSGEFRTQLIVISDFGCRDSIEKLVKIRSTFNIWIPTAFTPNNDGVNDLFRPHVSAVNYLSYQIDNRWGEQVFHDQ